MFRIQSNANEIVKQVLRKRGNYSLGKTILQEPLSKIEFHLNVYHDYAAISASLEGAFGTSEQDAMVSMIESILRAESFSTRTAKKITIGSDTGNGKAVISVHHGKPAPRLDTLSPFFFPFHSRGVEEELRTIKKNHDSEILALSILMGEDKEITLERLPVDDRLGESLEKFALVCQALVGGFYESQSVRVKDQQILNLQPVRLNNPKTTSGFGSLFDNLTQGESDTFEKAISIEKPTTTFAHIGGLPKAKQLVSRLAVALQNPDAYKKWGAHAPKGVLLHGKPGTGKTLLAKALANATDASFYHVKITDILSMWHGQSEEHIDKVFDIAKENSPSVIFFDELDALGRSRDDAGSEISSKIVAILLQNMDGIEQLERVIVLGATNRLDSIDSALQRPGRFDRKIYVPMPDQESLKQILRIQAELAVEFAGRKLFDSLNESLIAAKLNGYSGADVAEIIRRVLEEKAISELEGCRPELVTVTEIENEILNYDDQGEGREPTLDSAAKGLLKDYLMLMFLANTPVRKEIR